MSVLSEVSCEPEADLDGRFVRAALAVLERAGGDLVGTPFCLVLADERARVVERVDGDAGLAAKLDRLRVVPGCRGREGCRGLNAVGAGLVRGGGELVEGVSGLACAAIAVMDPRHGRRVGVVALVCGEGAASALMVSYVRRVGWEIENGLVDDASSAERALVAHFVRVRRHARGPIVSVNERTMITNAAAARLVDDADHSALWEWARGALAGGEGRVGELRLSSGVAVSVRCEPVESATGPVGALVRVGVALRVSSAKSGPAKGGRSRKRARRASFGWASLSPSQLGVAELVAGGLTNQEVAARLYLSRHTIDFHLREIYSKLGIDSRVKLARLVSEHPAAQPRLAS